MNKTILIGIDGATPDLLFKWIDENKLPNFKKIKEKGSWGNLKSTIPPFSAPAWTSIITGCNPGKHGIYGFEKTGTLTPHLINSRYRKTPAIWNYFSDIGLKNIIVNVPGSYPPEKINGIMITGLLTPSMDSDFTYPSELKKRLNKNDLGNYDLEQFWLDDFSRSNLIKNNPEKLLDNVISQIQTRHNVTTKLMDEIKWDFTMLVFRGTDTVQHFLFNKKELIFQCYKKIDELIGKIYKKYENANIFIVSDHGFEDIKKILYPDNVLYNKGYLTPAQLLDNSLNNKFNNLLSKFFKKLLEKLPKKFLQNSKTIKKILFQSSSKSKLINFDKTKAFTTADGRGIQICSKKRYEKGIVEENDYEKVVNELMTIFKELKDPSEKIRIIKRIYRSTEIYGKDAIEPPDLLLELEKGITAAEWLRHDKIDKNKKTNLPICFQEDSANRSGDHAQYGIFFGIGKNIKQNYQIKNITVEDILPTIFANNNLCKPSIITGKIKNEIFKNKPQLKKINWNQYNKKLNKSELIKIRKLSKKLSDIKKT